ncbi:hypothetical protein HT136_19585 [Novosphingobium profundi]|uniref:DUF6468 domain-containing protein n=1 Tax=Novosphingobium profundi TaxID=1774954 RepID=UPI001BDA012A|nr:DUF6468 domain-containing protein [Novosphingobium profundi]MBT0670574.1 hypothetical protein [Novosphingobium profundi]
MTFATVTNAALVTSCLTVLVQSWRMERRMKVFRETKLSEGVLQLDHATERARAVLGELKRLFATEGVAQAKAFSTAEELREELTMMVGIGNAVAERIMDAAADTHAKTAAKTEAKAAAKPRRRTAKTVEGEEEKAKPATTRRRAATRKSRSTKVAPAAKPVIAAVDAEVAPHPAKIAAAAVVAQVLKEQGMGEGVASRKTGKVVALPGQDKRREVALREVAAA